MGPVMGCDETDSGRRSKAKSQSTTMILAGTCILNHLKEEF